MAWALSQALVLYADPAAHARAVTNGMAQDFSWEQRAAQYVALYEALPGR